jgi:ABC-type cobalamin transport system ATPase subunit
MAVEQARAYLAQKNYSESKNDVNRAFTLAKQDEEARKKKEELMRNFKKLTL